MKINTEILEIARKYLDIVSKSGILVEKAFIFGSRAKGKASKFSDIDICIISSKLGKDYFDEAVKLATLTSKVDDRIEPKPFNPEDFANPYDPLAHEIRKHGIEIKPLSVLK